mgnify:CR=1 FL=1
MNKTEPTLECADFTAAFVRILTENGLAEFATEALADRFFALTERLLRVNAVMNLTAITDPHEIILKHYADSLRAAKYLPHGAKVADVGCGAGFPTLPLAAARPDLAITAIDSTDKRIVFVRETAALLGLDNVTAVTARAEDVGAGELRGKYDCVTARAVAALPVLIEICAPLLKVGGYFFAMKGKNADAELASSERAARELGLTLADTVRYELPEDSGSRAIFVYRKTSPTPARYPREYRKIVKAPL